MAAPTTYTTFLVQDIVDDAFRRCRVDVEGLTAVHNRDARKTLVFILSAWASRMTLPFQIKQGTIAVTANQAYVAAPADMVAPVLVAYRSPENIDFTLGELSPGQYAAITDKATGGQPNSYYFDQGLRRLYLWPVPDQTGTNLIYSGFARTPDNYNSINDLGLPFELWDAMAAELACRMSQKLAMVPADWSAHLCQLSEIAVRYAKSTGSAGTTVRITPTC